MLGKCFCWAPLWFFVWFSIFSYNLICTSLSKNCTVNYACCVFWPAFRCCAHLIAGQNMFFEPFSIFFVNFKHFAVISSLKSRKNIWKWTKNKPTKRQFWGTPSGRWSAFACQPASNSSLKHSSFLNIFSWFQTEIPWKTFEIKKKKVENGWKNNFNQLSKAGRNTQHIHTPY